MAAAPYSYTNTSAGAAGFNRHRALPPVKKEKTQADLDAIEKARLKRERKAAQKAARV
jgi:hypothetical protein